MPAGRNYLLGRGENLTTIIAPPGGGGDKSHPYSFEEAKIALVPRVVETCSVLDDLPLIACPVDQAIAVLTLHPAYLAKSYSPVGFLSAVGLRSVGSRTTTIVPRKVSNPNMEGVRIATTELFIAGPRHQFRSFAQEIATWMESQDGAIDLIKIEDFRALSAEERIGHISSTSHEPLLEVALHGAGLPINVVLDSFYHYVMDLGIHVDLNQRLIAGSLLFLPIRVPLNLVPSLARFSFLRKVREMPSLRLSKPENWLISSQRESISYSLPYDGPLDSGMKVAVFDGGLPVEPDLSLWVRQKEVADIDSAVPEYLDHGLAVTSALLFGPLSEDQEAPRPYAHVDHYRVLDDKTLTDPQGELYPVLNRIIDILASSSYDFVCLSIGPDQPIEDDIVDPWTTLLDQSFASGDTLAAIAVGNTGTFDRDAGLNRIQPPADCVNALAVGACDNSKFSWSRAPYSSTGPGRSPGRIKPDVLAFGGTDMNPYFVVAAGSDDLAIPVSGTSLAGPTALRTGLGLRAHLGSSLRPLAIKALLTHQSDMHYENHSYEDYGWGRVRNEIESMLTCSDDTVHVVYQGVLPPREHVRAKIPVPAGVIPGKVHLAITICIASETDPEHPSCYTRNGIDVVFRPHAAKFTKSKYRPQQIRIGNPTRRLPMALRPRSGTWP